MEMRQVDYVLAVVDRGSFTKAAAAMHVSQPSLSDGIRRLEAELDVRLFHRLGRSVALTDAGEAFVGPARQLVRDRNAVLESVGGVRAVRTGTLDFVALSTLAADPLGALVGRFRKAHPGVVVRIAAPDDVGSVDAMVLDGRCELGLTELPPRRDELVAVALERQEIVAVCPPRTRLAASGRIPLAKLRDMPLVTTPRGLSTRDLLDRALAEAGVEPAHRGRDVPARSDRPARARGRGHVVPARPGRRSRSAPGARSWPAWCPPSRARSASCTARRRSHRPHARSSSSARPKRRR